MKLKKMIALTLSAMLTLSPAYAQGLSAEAADKEVIFTDFDTSVNDGEVIRGVDISSIIAIENAGVVFRDKNGAEQDIFRTLAENGVNYIRVRVWNDPYDSEGNSYGGGNNDVYTAGLIGKRAAEYNMKLLVDIQYSDFWADPEKQTRPKYWSSHDHETLKTEIYKWTNWVLTSVTEAGGDIGMVQVGNETNAHFLDETDMYSICDLFASGDKAVRDFDEDILIAHHFADPSTGYYSWYAKVMNECSLDYDIFATSYYPYWHGTTENLTSVLKSIGDTYGKYVMVAETAYPYTSDDGDTFGNVVSEYSADAVFRYDISAEGQAECITDVFQAVANCGKWGIGAFYWEPAWLGVYNISWNEQKDLWQKHGSGWATDSAAEFDSSVTGVGGSSYDNQALFSFNGTPLKSLSVFNNIYPRKERDLPESGEVIEEGLYRIKNVSSGKYLAVEDRRGSIGGNVVQLAADGASEYNSWYIRSAGDGYYYLYSALDNGNKYMLDLSDGRPDNKTNIGIFTNTDSDAQKFKFIKNGNGYVIATKITEDKSAVEIENADGKDGANAQQFSRNGNDCQTWVLEPVERFIIRGDLNDDSCVNIFDHIILRQCLAEQRNPDAGDMNVDGKVTVADLVSLSSRLLGKKI